jgi:hypothetical protein
LVLETLILLMNQVKNTIKKHSNEQLSIPRKIYTATWRLSPQGGEVYLPN